jgi:hypothetical protein
MQTSGVRTTIICGDANVDVVWTIFVLCVLDENVPVTVFIEDIGVKDLELDNLAAAMLVLADEIFVWISLLRVFVQELHVRVSRR